MKKNNSNMTSFNDEPGHIEVLFMRKARHSDLIMIFVILFFGMLSIWSGRMLGYNMSPSGAKQTSSMLDELQMPRKLPNAQVRNEIGTMQNLWDITPDKFTILAVYAPWCGPCQEELPLIIRQLSKKKNFLVLVSKQEKPDAVREQLNNLGLPNIPFYQDVTGNILSQGKVTALPTTFLITINGRVLDRQVGYSNYRLHRLIRRASGDFNEYPF